MDDKTLEGRWPIWSDSLHLLAAYPLTGSGLGTYDASFPKYQTAEVDLDFDFAHNDYLQLAAEMGVMGFLILAGFVVAIVAKTVRAGTGHFSSRTRYFGWGCSGAIAAILLHSLTDFNTYIPANALALAWIFGIVAGLPTRSSFSAITGSPSGPVWFKGLAIALGCSLLIYAPAWILLETKWGSNPQAEIRFCRFGVCDTDAVVASETASHSGAVDEVPIAELREALRRDPAAPLRWCDLGDALMKLGEIEQARSCFLNALERGPNVPIAQLRAANFYYAAHEGNRALEQTSRLLQNSSTYDRQIFDRYTQEKMPLAEILCAGLPKNRRAWQSFLTYLMNLGRFPNAMTVWEVVLAQHYADDKLAREYVGVLVNDHRYEAAAKAWASYLGERRKGYLESNWVFNGDFETEPSGVAFDWKTENLSDDVKVAIDASVAHTGSHSLKIQFGGKTNVDYGGTSQMVFVRPGKYRFTAYAPHRGDYDR